METTINGITVKGTPAEFAELFELNGKPAVRAPMSPVRKEVHRYTAKRKKTKGFGWRKVLGGMTLHDYVKRIAEQGESQHTIQQNVRACCAISKRRPPKHMNGLINDYYKRWKKNADSTDRR